MRMINGSFVLLVALLSTGCATTTVHQYQAAGKGTLCNGTDLGVVAVLPEAAWRPDQKEPEKREAMALEEITRAFEAMPCGEVVEPGGVKAFSDWSAKPESALLEQFSTDGVDTLVIVRIEELTPRLFVTFSLPFLWAGSNEADFRIRVLSVETGAVLSDMRVKQMRGGPFNVRPAEWSRDELGSALGKVIVGGE